MVAMEAEIYYQKITYHEVRSLSIIFQQFQSAVQYKHGWEAADERLI